jgi:hypothetical protein
VTNAGRQLGGMLVNPERANPNTQAIAASIGSTFTPANNTTKSSYTSGPQNFVNTAYQAVQGFFNRSSLGAGIGFTMGSSAAGNVVQNSKTSVIPSGLSLKNLPGTIQGLSTGIVSIGKSISDAANALGFNMNRSVLDTSTGPAINPIGGQNSLDLAGLNSAISNVVQVAATSGYRTALGAFQSFSPGSSSSSSDSAGSPANPFGSVNPTYIALFAIVLVGFFVLRKA